MSVPTVLVTGASGFIATHIVQQLQQTGKYKVKTFSKFIQTWQVLNSIIVNTCNFQLFRVVKEWVQSGMKKRIGICNFTI